MSLQTDSAKLARIRSFAMPVRCPHCFRFGNAKHYGRVRCSACGGFFMLGGRGRPVRSLWRAAAGPISLLLYFALFALFITLCREDSGQLWWAALGVVLAVMDLRAAWRTKEFVTQ